jgi:hypothetical protein
MKMSRIAPDMESAFCSDFSGAADRWTSGHHWSNAKSAAFLAPLVDIQMLGGDVLERGDVDLILELGHRRGLTSAVPVLGSPRQHRLFAHPQQVG